MSLPPIPIPCGSYVVGWRGTPHTRPVVALVQSNIGDAGYVAAYLTRDGALTPVTERNDYYVEAVA